MTPHAPACLLDRFLPLRSTTIRSLFAVAALALAAVPPAASAAELAAYWDFDDATDPFATTDSVDGLVGDLIAGAVFTPDGEGRTESAGDRAIDFGFDSAGQTVQVFDGSFLNDAAADDQMTVTFWQRLYAVASTSSFWMVSPGSAAEQRGSQVHVPWGNGIIYFDTAGCCGADTRISGTPPGVFFEDWNHFAFVKNGDTKEIWINGELFLSGTGASPLPTDFIQLNIGSSGTGANSLQGIIDDFAVFSTALEEDEIVFLAEGGTPPELVDDTDTDMDGMPDRWEDRYQFDKNNPDDAGLDTDEDGLTNLQEFERKTHPRVADTDDDGLLDGVETGTGTWVSAEDTGTGPRQPDTDGDGLLDGLENPDLPFTGPTQPGTSPHLADTDDDGFSDRIELENGSDPTNPNSVPDIAVVTLLGTGTGALLGGDLTDPEDDADDTFPADDLDNPFVMNGLDVVNLFTSDLADEGFSPGDGFGGNEKTYDIFDNKVGGGEAKWCCNGAPLTVTVEFENPISLTHFTITSGNDTPAREPLDWRILGSNDFDGIDGTFTPIFTQTGDTSIWGGVINLVARIDLPSPAPPYKFIRYEVTRTGGPNHQINEIEYFGTVGAGRPFLITDINRDATTGEITLTWNSRPGSIYGVFFSTTLDSFDADVSDSVPSGGDTTTFTFDNPLPSAPELFFRVTEFQ